MRSINCSSAPQPGQVGVSESLIIEPPQMLGFWATTIDKPNSTIHHALLPLVALIGLSLRLTFETTAQKGSAAG